MKAALVVATALLVGTASFGTTAAAEAGPAASPADVAAPAATPPPVIAPPQPGPARQYREPPTRVSRLLGRDRTALSVAVSRTAFPRGAVTAYLATTALPADALIAGQLTDGPVLVVAASGAGAATARAEVRRLKARTVIAIGSVAAVPTRTLAAGTPRGVRSARIGGVDAIRTSRLVAARAFPRPISTAYVVGASRLSDASVVGQLTDGPILLTTPSSASTSGLRWRGRPRVVAVGGTNAVADTALAAARRAGAATSRLSGGGVSETAIATAARAFPTGTATAYLVPAGDLFTAALSGGLRGGVVLVAPRCGALPARLAGTLRVWRPDRLVAVGSGRSGICQSTLQAAAAASRA